MHNNWLAADWSAQPGGRGRGFPGPGFLGLLVPSLSWFLRSGGRERAGRVLPATRALPWTATSGVKSQELILINDLNLKGET